MQNYSESEADEQICRLCLTIDSPVEPLFNNSDSNLFDKVSEFTQFKLYNIDGLPTALCEVCKSRVIIYVQFRRRCQMNNDNLLANYYKNEIEEIEEVIDRPTENRINQQEAVIESDEKMIENHETSDLNIEEEYEEERFDDITIEEVEEEYLNSPDVDESTTEAVKNRGKRKEMCYICGLKFVKLMKHISDKHSTEDPYKCDQCDKGFKSYVNYCHHMNTHSGENPYKCTKCEAAYPNPHSLKYHSIAKHTNGKNYHCDSCDKKFFLAHSLSAHRRTHIQDRRHSCTVCERLFLHRTPLKHHMKTHTGEKPYECDVCLKRFTTTGNLATHSRVHTGEKPYKCKFCDLRFGYPNVLQSHMGREHQ